MRSPAGYSLLANLAYLKNAGNMNKMYFISDSHQVVYIRMLKCASTSVLREFLPLVDSRLKVIHFSDDQLDALAFHYQRKSIPPGDRYKKFTLVRNPLSRIVSVYLDLFDPSSDMFTYSAYWFGILRAGMSFKDFLKTIEQIPISLLGPHFTPQSHILNETSAPDEILVFRVDKDAESLKIFLQQYGLQLSHLNKRQQDYNYSSFYDSEMLDIAGRLYADDIKQFGYVEDFKVLQRTIHDHE